MLKDVRSTHVDKWRTSSYLWKVYETRSHAHTHGGSGEEDKMVTRSKQKAENKAHEAEQSSPKKAKSEEENGRTSATKSAEASLPAEFEDFYFLFGILKGVILLVNSQDMLFFGALEKCPVCSGTLVFDGKSYGCSGFDSEWSSCTFKTKSPPLFFPLVAEELSEFGSSFSEECRESRQTIFRNDDLALWSTV